MNNNKQGFMFAEVIVAITISVIVMGALTGFLPSMMMKNNIISNKNIETKKAMIDYMIVMKDLRTAEMTSRLGEGRMRIYKKGKIVEYKIIDGWLTRMEGGHDYTTVYKDIKIYTCNKVVKCDGWVEISKSWKLRDAGWWKVSMGLGKSWNEGVVRGG